MEKYELVKDIGSGNFGVARLMRNKETKELVAMKYIERGYKVAFQYLAFILILVKYLYFGALYVQLFNFVCSLLPCVSFTCV